jgi:hypothetical protein
VKRPAFRPPSRDGAFAFCRRLSHPWARFWLVQRLVQEKLGQSLPDRTARAVAWSSWGTTDEQLIIVWPSPRNNRLADCSSSRRRTVSTEGSFSVQPRVRESKRTHDKQQIVSALHRRLSCRHGE